MTKTDRTERRAVIFFRRWTRGPLLVTAVTLSTLFPYLQHFGLWNLFLHVVVAVVGTMWCIQDACQVTKTTLLAFCSKALDGIVLDDLLRSIYDPETGWIACCTGIFLGSSTMYGLKMSPEQRIKLVQATLAQEQGTVSQEETARTILMEPGGCKVLLPDSLQKWLANDDAEAKNASGHLVHQTARRPDHIADDVDVSVDHTQSTICFDMTEMETKDDFILDGETMLKARGLHFHEEATFSNEHQSKPQSKEKTSTSPPSNPISVFATILKEMALEQITPYAEAFPRSKAENVGMTAVGTQLVLFFLLQRPQRGSSKTHWWKRLCAMALSSVAAASFGSILAQEAVLGKICDRRSLQASCKGMMYRIVEQIKGRVLSNKAKTCLAMIILILLGRKPHSKDPMHL
jgi:hypothetical protein